MTREDIEQLINFEPYCFENVREEMWYEIGCIDGLKAADAEPNLESLWRNAGEEPKDNSKIIIVDTEGEWRSIDYVSDDYDGWKFCIEIYNIKIWAYKSDLLPKGGER